MKAQDSAQRQDASHVQGGAHFCAHRCLTCVRIEECVVAPILHMMDLPLNPPLARLVSFLLWLVLWCSVRTGHAPEQL